MGKLRLYYIDEKGNFVDTVKEIEKDFEFSGLIENFKKTSKEKMVYSIYQNNEGKVFCYDAGCDRTWETTYLNLNVTFPNFMFHFINDKSDYKGERLLEIMCYFRDDFWEFLPLNDDKDCMKYLEFMINTLNINFNPDDDFISYLDDDYQIEFEDKKITFDFISIQFIECLTDICMDIMGDRAYDYLTSLIKTKLAEVEITIVSRDITEKDITDFAEMLKRSNWLYDKKDAELLTLAVRTGYVNQYSATQAELTPKATTDFPQLFLFENRLKLFNLFEGELTINSTEMKNIFKKIGENIVSCYQMYDSEVNVEFKITERDEKQNEKILKIGKNLFPTEMDIVENVSLDGNILKIEFFTENVAVNNIKNIDILTETNFIKYMREPAKNADDLLTNDLILHLDSELTNVTLYSTDYISDLISKYYNGKYDKSIVDVYAKKYFEIYYNNIKK